MRCSFCDRSQAEVSHLVAGASANICDDCVATAQRAIWSRRPVGYLYQLLVPHASEAWLHYVLLLGSAPTVATFVATWSALPRWEPSFHGGVLLVCALASVGVCSWMLTSTFLAVAGNVFVSRLFAGTTWALAGLFLGQQWAGHGAVGAMVACLASQVIVSLRPRA